jgi:ribosomal protein S18 acetylase RimI-like enzyme
VVPERFHRFWIAFDGLAADVEHTAWGAVVTDARSPDVWDNNYARVDRAGPVSVREVEANLLPALRAVGTTVEHLVSFRHEAHGSLLDELSARGHRLSWDMVMVSTERPSRGAADTVEELVPGEELWDAAARALRDAFRVEPDSAVDQLIRLDREVLSPAGRRWFGVRDGGRDVVSVGTLLVLDGVAYVDDVATLPAARGRGHASAVVSRIVAEARASHADEVYLLVDPDAAPVIAMYERLGFRDAGRLASTRGPMPVA